MSASEAPVAASKMISDDRPQKGSRFAQMVVEYDYNPIAVGTNDDGSTKYESRAVGRKAQDRGCFFGSLVRTIAKGCGLYERPLNAYSADEWRKILSSMYAQIDKLSVPEGDWGYPDGWDLR